MMRKQITAKTMPTIIGMSYKVLESVLREFDKCYYYIIKQVPDEEKAVIYLHFLSK